MASRRRRMIKLNNPNFFIRNKPIISYNDSNIVLIQQYHIPKDTKRKKEIQDTLRRNVENPHITKLYLLNERQYTNDELGFSNNTPLPKKIQQIVMYRRLTYKLAFMFVRQFIKDAWVIVSNNDIYYDETLKELPNVLKRKHIHHPPKCMCLKRYELIHNRAILYTPPNTNPGCAQDSWIFYSSECPEPINYTNFHLGKPGCDNRIAYILRHNLGFEVVNIPSKIKSYHNHKSNLRYYNPSDSIKGRYLIVKPT